MKDDIATYHAHRSGLLDALKGFALLGLLILNYVQHFLYPYMPNGVNPSNIFWMIDKGVYDLVVAMLELKVLGMFALLFGVSFNYQYGKQKAKNKSFWLANIWRLYILGFFGLVLALLMPNGSGLLLIVSFGLILSFLRRLSRRAILIIALVCLSQPLTWLQYLLSLIAPFTPMVGRETDIYYHLSMIAMNDNILAYIYQNVVEGFVLSMKLIFYSGFSTIVLGMMLFGYWLGRKNLLNRVGYDRQWWIRCVQISMAGVIVFGLLSYNLEYFLPESNHSLVLVSVFANWMDVALIMTLVSGFVIFYKSARYPKAYEALTIFGRMSLTNYLLQSLFGVLFFLPVGLSLAQYCGTILSLLIAGAVFVLLVLFSRKWQRHFVRGPLEHVVHKLTWL